MDEWETQNWLEANKWEDGIADDIYTRELIGGQQMGGRDSRRYTLENWLEANKWEDGIADDIHSRIDWRPTNGRTG